MIFGIRYLANKEKMAMIERGIDPGIHNNTETICQFKIRLAFNGAGNRFTGGITVRGVFGSNLTHEEESQTVAVYFGCLGVFCGLGLIISYLIEKKWLDQESSN